MTKSTGPSEVGNPFSTRHVRPGAMAYRFSPGQDVDGLVERLSKNDWRGQIVGPHGSGKSALTATLAEALRQAGREALLIELHDGERRLPVSRAELKRLRRGSVVIVDGYEQLARRRRALLRRFCRRRRLGLVVTSHASMGNPDLVRTAPSLALAETMVEDLLRRSASTVDKDAIHQSFRRHEGNLREVLFDLYDVCERRALDGL